MKRYWIIIGLLSGLISGFGQSRTDITDTSGSPGRATASPGVEAAQYTTSPEAGRFPPSNDACSTATAITALPFADNVDATTATPDPTDPVLSCGMGGGGNTVWYVFTPAASMTVSVSTSGSNYDTVLGLLTGTCGALTEVACNDDAIGLQSVIVFTAQAGVTYYIMVGEFGGPGIGGNLVFTVTEVRSYQGPESGTIAGGASQSTDIFPLRPGLAPPPIPPGRRLPYLDLPLPGNPKQPLVEPTGPVGSHFVADAAPGGQSPMLQTLPALQDSFPGIADPGLVIPPDPHMAVGPNHLMGTVNQQFAIFDKTGTMLKLINAADWFANVHPGGGPFDPQILFDHHSRRWIMVWIDFTSAPPQSFLLLSVSDDDNPLGSWCNWRLPGNQNGSTPNTFLNDYPKLGVDADAVYVTANMFDIATQVFQYVQVRIIPKAQLLTNTCASITWTDLWDLRNPANLAAPTFTTVPAVTFGTPGVEYLVDVDFIQATGTFMNLWALTDPLGTPTLTATAVPVAAFTSPPNAQQLGGGTPPIDVGGRRNRNVVYRDGSVWTAHSIADPTGQFARLRYVRMDVATATAVEDVTFGLDNFWYYYPAVHPDGNNNLVITFTRSGFTEYAGARYTGRMAGDPPGLAPSGLLKPGEDNYVKTFTGTRNRWGDYLGIALDPTDSTRVWMFGEYAATAAGPGANDDRWGTWFGSVSYPTVCPPDIAVSPVSFAFTVLPGDTASATLTLSNAALPGCNDLTWTLTDQQNLQQPVPGAGRVPRSAGKKTPRSPNLSRMAVAESEGIPEVDCPWLSAAPLSGTLPAGATQQVTVSVNAAGLVPGTYQCSLVITSNDPDENPLTIPVTLTVADQVGVSWCNGDTLIAQQGVRDTVYVCVDDLTGLNVTSFQLVAGFDPAVLSCVGATTAGTVADPFGPPTVNCTVPGQITVGAFGATPLAGGGMLIGLIFDVTGSPGATTDVCVVDVMFNGGNPAAALPTPCRPFKVDNLFDIAGTITYCQNGNPVPGTTLSLSGGATATQISDVVGNYRFADLLFGLNYTVTPDKVGDVNPFTDISCFDASLVAQIAAGLRTADHCDSLSADVDEDGNIFTFDAALICRFAVGLPPFDTTDHTGQWRFEPVSRTYTALSTDQLHQDYSAALLGDVDGNWVPGAAAAPASGAPGRDPLANLKGASGEILRLPFAVKADDKVLSVDIDLRYDPAVMEFLGIERTELSRHFQLMVNPEEGRVRAGAYHIEPLREGGTFLWMNFRIIGEERAKGQLQLARYALNGLPVAQGEMQFVVGVPPVPERFTLHQNQPNPFNPGTVIRFQIPALSRKQVPVRLSIYNISGQLVRVLLNDSRGPGVYAVRWDGRDDAGNPVASGIYIYALSAGDFFATRKMMLLK
ncbi:MAG: T9SS C-terminal target domain-containing protein [Calditrichaeota bacterium]|nr:MAG: T9SS C-terminal target domain-containing protein [Calditrichota bacterium]